MVFDSELVQAFSRISSRGVFGKALCDIEPIYDDLRVVVADVTSSSRLEKFALAAPNKFINVGIAEQNMVGIAAGLASVGKTVFAVSFAPFASMRPYEMIRSQIGYMNLNVKVVGLMSGFSGGVVGNTHYGLEDIALMRIIPNMTVICPADGVETYKAVCSVAAVSGPAYIRLTGTNGTMPVYKEDYRFEIGKGVVLKRGKNVAIIATGTMVSEALRAARGLARANISATVVDMHTIKPLDEGLLEELFLTHDLMVTLEEHFAKGGLGSAVAEFCSDKPFRRPHLIIGIPDDFEKAGQYTFMLNKCGLTASQISKRIEGKLKEQSL